MLPRRCHTFVRFCHKQSRCLVLSGAASPNRLDETFQVFYQKIFTSVKYCLAMLSADTGKIGPHRTFQSKRDHFHQNPNQSQTGCDIWGLPTCLMTKEKWVKVNKSWIYLLTGSFSRFRRPWEWSGIFPRHGRLIKVDQMSSHIRDIMSSTISAPIRVKISRGWC